MIQLYAKLSDLSPTEEKLQVSTIEEFCKWFDSIKEDGIKYQLHVDHRGKIRDGNARYYIAQRLGHTHVPISWQYFLGIQYLPARSYYEMHPSIREYITDRAFTEVKEIIRGDY